MTTSTTTATDNNNNNNNNQPVPQQEQELPSLLVFFGDTFRSIPTLKAGGGNLPQRRSSKHRTSAPGLGLFRLNGRSSLFGCRSLFLTKENPPKVGDIIYPGILMFRELLCFEMRCVIQ